MGFGPLLLGVSGSIYNLEDQHHFLNLVLFCLWHLHPLLHLSHHLWKPLHSFHLGCQFYPLFWYFSLLVVFSVLLLSLSFLKFSTTCIIVVNIAIIQFITLLIMYCRLVCCRANNLVTYQF